MTCIVKVTYSTLVLIFFNIITSGVNGNNVKVQDYPSKVIVQSFGVPHSCAGVLITPRHVLTVAHCVVKKNTREEYLDAQTTKAYKVIPIDVTLTGDPTKLRWRQDNEFWVSNVDIHKNRQSSDNISADIAVLTLFVGIEANETRMHSLLPKSDSIDDEKLTALAYGFDYNVNAGVQGNETNLLTLGQFKISNDSDCENNNNEPQKIDEFCVTNLKKDTCYGYAGDSLKNKNNEVVGLITDSWNCTNQSIRVLNIIPYKSWINDIINTGYSSQTKLVRRMYTTFVD
ncbi:trypsin-like [Aphidius gifuensis]|uniref:trypsin-like n=1 Tax=Aphidius gifuensis TaxID=684658 RepID=UPI001CDD6788|nr:trypsin-like [Aphidius gifuensis]XP_044012638.1 trypsin-like [Aphidius gifuensis]